MNFNQIYKSIDIEDANSNRNFWFELGVNYDVNIEKNTTELFNFIRRRLNQKKTEELRELLGLFSIDSKGLEVKEDLINQFKTLSKEQKVLLNNLIKYISRKRRAIDEYYASYYQNNFESILSKIYHIYQQKTVDLFSINILNRWRNYSSGTLFTVDQINEKSVNSLLCEEKLARKLCRKLKNESRNNNDYKLHSYCEINNKRIIMLYKQVNDISRSDFESALRNKDVDIILFCLDIKEKLIEIKSNKKFEQNAIVSYLEELLESNIDKIEDRTYEDIDIKEVRESILSGESASGERVLDFIVEEIKFRDSFLSNSPSIAFSIENTDISPSVRDAYEKEIINLTSLKSIESITFRTDATRRTVRSKVLEDGNIIFEMDDSRMSQEKRTLLKEKFYQRFGIPLYKKISNLNSVEGASDFVDYLMRVRKESELTNSEQEKQKELIDKNILRQGLTRVSRCKNKMCFYVQELKEEDITPIECPECECEIIIREETRIDLNKDKIRSFIKEKLDNVCKVSKWIYYDNKNRTINSEVYEFFRMKNSEERGELYILITTRMIPQKDLNILRKSLEPILIIVVGQSNNTIERYRKGNLEAVSFGVIYENGTKELDKLLTQYYKKIEFKLKENIAIEASKASESIKENKDNPKLNSYSYADFEDDVYLILKDIFLNVSKWGKDNVAEEIPEGVFSLYYKDQNSNSKNEVSVAFSYDCKLNENLKGYDFNIGEKDKAKRYIKKLSDIPEISQLIDGNHLTGHIIISNKLKSKNVKNAYNDIKRDIRRIYNTEVIFISVDALLCLMDSYRSKFNLVESSKDLFYLFFHKIIMDLKGEIFDIHHVDTIMQYVIRYAERKILDMDVVLNQLRDDIFGVAN